MRDTTIHCDRCKVSITDKTKCYIIKVEQSYLGGFLNAFKFGKSIEIELCYFCYSTWHNYVAELFPLLTGDSN